MSDPRPTLAFDLERDVVVLSAMASNLTPYLYEKEMYGYLAGDLPKLTLGGLLMRLHRLTGLGDLLDAEQQTVVQDASINLEAERSEWSVHYEMKLQQELHARLGALDQFLQDCSEDLRECAVGYPVQAEKRVMIEHLVEEAEERDCLPEELRVRVRQVDARLRRVLQDGEFIFDERLKPVYPRERFWWLYAIIPEDRR